MYLSFVFLETICKFHSLKNLWKSCQSCLHKWKNLSLDEWLIANCFFNVIYFKSSRPEVFCRKGVLRNFVKLTGKRLCQNLFFNKVPDLRPATLLKKAQVFSCEFCEISKITFFTEHFWWLLLFLCTFRFARFLHWFLLFCFKLELIIHNIFHEYYFLS